MITGNNLTLLDGARAIDVVVVGGSIPSAVSLSSVGPPMVSNALLSPNCFSVGDCGLSPRPDLTQIEIGRRLSVCDDGRFVARPISNYNKPIKPPNQPTTRAQNGSGRKDELSFPADAITLI